jgi:hypothetical protein
MIQKRYWILNKTNQNLKIVIFCHCKPCLGKLLFVHSFECQRIQIKNPFGEILGLGFDLGHLKMNIYYIKNNQFLQKNIKMFILKNCGKIN